jgi:hypothetical protein
MEKIFMIFYENADGVGGDKIIYGESYSELMDNVIERIEAYVDSNYEQVEEDEPDVLEDIERMRKKNPVTKVDVLKIDMTVLGVNFECRRIFIGEDGFLQLVSHIKAEYYDWSDDSHMEYVDEDDVIFLNKLVVSYSDDSVLAQSFDVINDKIWCS